MSTDQQHYSPKLQAEAIRIYAARHGLEIVRTYVDEGETGLHVYGRNGFRQLLNDIQSGSADYDVLVVYDVSRWGRFQDPDESAYYEFICKRAGIQVVYCAEQFDNDGGPLAALLKGLKRAQAAEFSRELSVKVFAGQSHLARMGCRLGGPAGYGLRRLLVDQNGIAKCILGRGEWKNITTDRIVLVPGPSHEIQVVRLIFSMFVHDRKHERRIVEVLNRQNIPYASDRPWDHNVIRRMLKNEKYIGNNVWNRCSFKLQKVRVYNNPDQWVRANGVFEPIVDRALFDQAQQIFRTRTQFSSGGRPMGLSNEEMLNCLRVLWRKHGYLSRVLIDSAHDLPSSEAFCRRFGNLRRPYGLIGYKERKLGYTRTGRPLGWDDARMLEALRRLWNEHGYLTHNLVASTNSLPARSAYSSRFGTLTHAYQLIGYTPGPRQSYRKRLLRRASNEALLDALRQVLREHGRLTRRIIDRSASAPSHSSIEKRFGKLTTAYRLIGYHGARGPVPIKGIADEEMLESLRKLLRERGHLSQGIIREARATMPSCYAYYKRFGNLTHVYQLIGYKRGSRLSRDQIELSSAR
jgi:DNA invertase Pin-like site-specific DNA recombinase